MNITKPINSDRRLGALLKLLACESAYGLFLLLPCDWAMNHHIVSVRTGFGTFMIGSFLVLFITWVLAFKPYRK